MKQMKQMIAAMALGLVCVSNYAKASVTINADGGYFTSSGANIANGVLLFISNGSNASFDSGVWSTGATTLINSDDKLVGALDITAGTFQGVLTFDLVGISANQKLTGLFMAGNVASFINTATGSLIGSNTFLSTGGTSFKFGSYRTDSIESYGGPAGDFIAWAVPADGATVTLSVASGSGDYSTGSIVAALGTTGTFNIGTAAIPEPSVASLFALGTVGLVALRVRRKS